MKKPILLLALGLSMALSNAYADTYDATVSGDGYLFSNSFSGTNSFDDYIAFSTEGIQNIVASISGSGDSSFAFKSFTLLDSDKNLIVTGNVFSPDPQVAFGYVKSLQEGSYYLHVTGQSSGATAGYTGTITLATAVVPEPEAFALMLSGLGLVSLLARRKIGSKQLVEHT